MPLWHGQRRRQQQKTAFVGGNLGFGISCQSEGERFFELGPKVPDVLIASPEQPPPHLSTFVDRQVDSGRH